MFENIIEQNAVSQLRDDIAGGSHAPSMLFFGPSESGKGSAALELARALSCTKDASWQCTCPSCERHRYLQHDDLVMLGKKSFTSEIAACRSVFLRNPSSISSKILFFRSLRKLQLRFSPVVMEDDPKLSKFSSTLQSLDEGINGLLAVKASEDDTSLEKLCNSLVKDASTLNEGLSDLIPVGHVRNAAYWCRLAPYGKQKVLIIENADSMRDEARNSLLKLLEEPPSTVNIVLTTKRREAVLPTILSRLRPYRFMKRSVEGEKEILRRIFHAPAEFGSSLENSPEAGNSLISAYLDSFLVRNTEKLYPLAVWFIASLASITAVSLKKKKKDIPGFITALGERYAPMARASESGLQIASKSADLAKTLLLQTGNFEDDSFSRFLKLCLDLAAVVLKQAQDPAYIKYGDMFRKYTGEAVTAVDVFNQSPALALEAFIYKIKSAMGTRAA